MTEQYSLWPVSFYHAPMMLVTDRLNNCILLFRYMQRSQQIHAVKTTWTIIRRCFKVMSLLGIVICYEVVMMNCVYLCFFFVYVFIRYVRKLSVIDMEAKVKTYFIILICN